MFDESLQADCYSGAHRLHIYFQLIYSHYAAPQTSMRGDFCPAVIFHDTEVEGKMGKHVSTEKKTEASDGAGGGLHSCSALPLNSDTFDNAGSVFRACVNDTSSFFPPSLDLQWKSHIHCHVMRPSPA